MGQFGLSWLAIDLCTFLTRHALPIDPMNAPYPSKFVDGSRLWQRLEALAQFGATPSGGVSRPALSPAEFAARRQLLNWAQDAGLGAASDPAGNLFFRLPGRHPNDAPVLTGSYLDSQLNGGRYSGSYGMLAALEALAAVAASGATPRRPIVAALWMNGEGTRFSPGYMGSATFAGECPLHRILDVHDRDGVSVASALSDLSATFAEVPRIALGFPCAAYLEAHLEQGPTLDDSGCQIGIVTAMQGVRRYSVHVEGEAAHAGSMPRHRRRDALSATVRIISSLEDFYAAPDVTFTVGQLSVEPNAPSVVPRETRFSIDIRHRDNLVLARLGEAIRLVCESEKKPCAATMTDLEISPSVEFDAGLQQVMRTCAERLGLTQMPLVSLGGHDAKSLVGHCPSGIVFIPCHGGVSHSEAESIDAASALNGAKVLTDALWELSNG